MLLHWRCRSCCTKKASGAWERCKHTMEIGANIILQKKLRNNIHTKLQLCTVNIHTKLQLQLRLIVTSTCFFETTITSYGVRLWPWMWKNRSNIFLAANHWKSEKIFNWGVSSDPKETCLRDAQGFHGFQMPNPSGHLTVPQHVSSFLESIGQRSTTPLDSVLSKR